MCGLYRIFGKTSKKLSIFVAVSLIADRDRETHRERERERCVCEGG